MTLNKTPCKRHKKSMFKNTQVTASQTLLTLRPVSSWIWFTLLTLERKLILGGFRLSVPVLGHYREKSPHGALYGGKLLSQLHGLLRVVNKDMLLSTTKKQKKRTHRKTQDFSRQSKGQCHWILAELGNSAIDHDQSIIRKHDHWKLSKIIETIINDWFWFERLKIKQNHAHVNNGWNWALTTRTNWPHPLLPGFNCPALWEHTESAGNACIQ